MNKIFHTLFAITIVCFSHSVYGMEETGHTNKTIQIPKDTEKNIERSPLHYASCKGDINAITSLLNAGADVNQIDQNGATALHCASWYGHTNIVRLLCDHGAQVNLAKINGDTPLHIAQSKNHVEIIQLLIDAGARANKINEDEEITSWQERIRKL